MTTTNVVTLALVARTSERTSGTYRGVLVTVETLPNGDRFATTTFRGECHGMTIPKGTDDAVSYAGAAARGIASNGVDGRKGPLAVYSSASN